MSTEPQRLDGELQPETDDKQNTTGSAAGNTEADTASGGEPESGVDDQTAAMRGYDRDERHQAQSE